MTKQEARREIMILMMNDAIALASQLNHLELLANMTIQHTKVLNNGKAFIIQQQQQLAAHGSAFPGLEADFCVMSSTAKKQQT